MAIMHIHHTGLWVRDLERSRSFFEQFFHARAGAIYRNPVSGFQSYFLEFESGARLELMWKPALADPSAAEAYGWAHLAFAFPDPASVDTHTGLLREAGSPVLGEPRRTGDGYYEAVVADPDGNRIELVAKPSTAAPGR